MLRFLQVQIIPHKSITPSVNHHHSFIIPVTQAVLQELKVLLVPLRKVYMKIMESQRALIIELSVSQRSSSLYFSLLPLLSHSPALKVVSIKTLPLRDTNFEIDCTCAGEKPPNYVDERWNVTKDFTPIATNGQPFPWKKIRLPDFVRPLRYNITIHPNLTTLEVKGKHNTQFSKIL